MRGVNKVIIVGTLGADPETRYTASGTAITNARLATNEEWKDKQTGERQSRTDWHSVVFFGRLAEIAAEYLRKGKQVYIEGQLRTEEYEKDGIKRYATKIYVREMQMLGGAGGDGQRSEGGQQRSGTRQQSAPAREELPPGGIPMSGDNFEDDIPY
jgi:single-strand DNA-binding protein